MELNNNTIFMNGSDWNIFKLPLTSPGSREENWIRHNNANVPRDTCSTLCQNSVQVEVDVSPQILTSARFWEGDHDITKSVEKNETSQEDIENNNVKDISRQLVESEAGNKLDIMLGGGRASFLPWSRKPQIVVNKTDAPGFDYEDENDIWDNYRDDDRDLLAEWENNTSHGKRKYIDTKELLLADDLTDNDQVMGEHMSLRNCSSCEQKL